MLEQPLAMSSALRASARSLGFLMGYGTSMASYMYIVNITIFTTYLWHNLMCLYSTEAWQRLDRPH